MKTPTSVTEATKRRRPRLQKQFTGVSRTKQSFKDECDINNILKRYNATGVLPDAIKQNPKYGDFSSPQSYQDSLNTVLFAQDQFSKLSATVRERFNNNPVKFLEFTADPKNLPEMVSLGLAIQRQTNQTNDDQATDTKTDPKSTKGTKNDPAL